MEKLLTIQQLSEIIQMSPKTIYQWTHVGFVPFYKFPKGIRFKEKDIDDWLKRRRQNGRISLKLQI